MTELMKVHAVPQTQIVWCNKYDWFKEWIYFFFVYWWKYPTEKKMTGNCIIARSAWCKVSVIFFRADTPSTNKTNKFIPYHLIISKHKYYVIKLYMFHDLFMYYILWRLSSLWRLIICVTDRFFPVDTKITPIFQPIEKRVTWKIKW